MLRITRRLKDLPGTYAIEARCACGESIAYYMASALFWVTDGKTKEKTKAFCSRKCAKKWMEENI